MTYKKMWVTRKCVIQSQDKNRPKRNWPKDDSNNGWIQRLKQLSSFLGRGGPVLIETFPVEQKAQAAQPFPSKV